MTLGWLIFWIIYVLVALAFVKAFHDLDSLNTTFDIIAKSQPKISSTWIFCQALILLTLVVIMWPLFTIYAIINSAIKAKK